MRKDYSVLHCLLLLLCCSFTSLAQIQVSGTVKDEGSLPLPGVNIIVKGQFVWNRLPIRKVGFRISVPNSTSVLAFSFIGYAPQEVSVGDRTIIDITLALDIKSLEEVVVTALGIEKSSKSLGYSTSKVSSDQLSINRNIEYDEWPNRKNCRDEYYRSGDGPDGYFENQDPRSNFYLGAKQSSHCY